MNGCARKHVVAETLKDKISEIVKEESYVDDKACHPEMQMSEGLRGKAELVIDTAWVLIAVLGTLCKSRCRLQYLGTSGTPAKPRVRDPPLRHKIHIGLSQSALTQ